MQPFTVLIRSLKLILLASAIPILLGATVAGRIGAVSGFLITLFFMMIGYFFSANLFLGRLKDVLITEASPTLVRSLELALAGTPLNPPEVLIVPAVTLSAFALRDGSGRRLLMISQGLLAGLSEDELRAILRLGACKITERGTPIRCLSALMAAMLLGITPKAWGDLILEGSEAVESIQSRLSALNAVLFWTFVPWISSLIRLSEGSPNGTAGAPLHSAVHKMLQDRSTSVYFQSPAYRYLALADANARKSLFPILPAGT